MSMQLNHLNESISSCLVFADCSLSYLPRWNSKYFRAVVSADCQPLLASDVQRRQDDDDDEDEVNFTMTGK